MMNLKVVHPVPGVHLPAVEAEVAEENQPEMIVGVLVRRAGNPGLLDLNYLRPKLMAVSDCFYTDSWKLGSLRGLHSLHLFVGGNCLEVDPQGYPHQDSPFSVVEASFAVVAAVAVAVAVAVVVATGGQELVLPVLW